jgi:hypothetical protein
MQAMQRISGGGGGSTTVLTLPPPPPPTNPETQDSLSSYEDGANREAEAEAGGEGQGAVDDEKRSEEAGKFTLDPLGSDPLMSVFKDGMPNAAAKVLVVDREDGAVDDHLQNLRREHEIDERGKKVAESTVSEVVARPASLSSTQCHLEDRGIDLSLATVRGSLPDISLACPPSPSMEEASWRYV